MERPGIIFKWARTTRTRCSIQSSRSISVHTHCAQQYWRAASSRAMMHLIRSGRRGSSMWRCAAMTALSATMVESAGLVRTIKEAHFVASVARCNVATFSSSSNTSHRPRQRTSLATEASCQVPPARRQHARSERECSPSPKQGTSGCCRQGTCRNSTCTRCQRQYHRLSLTARKRYCLLLIGPSTLTPV